jgi:hypothetical protein
MSIAPKAIEKLGVNEMTSKSKPKPQTIEPIRETDTAMSIKKPSRFSLDKFKTKRAATVANVDTLLTGLAHHPIAQAKDFVHLHPNEGTFWSPELCFVNCRSKGRSAIPPSDRRRFSGAFPAER